MPRAPTGVSGSGISTAAHFMLTGISRIDGGRFWYHVKSSANADLSLGAGGSLRHTSPPGGGNSADEVYIEAGLQIRVFLASAVSLSVSSGLVVGAADADGLAIGQGPAVGLNNSAALHYYF